MCFQNIILPWAKAEANVWNMVQLSEAAAIKTYLWRFLCQIYLHLTSKLHVVWTLTSCSVVFQECWVRAGAVSLWLQLGTTCWIDCTYSLDCALIAACTQPWLLLPELMDSLIFTFRKCNSYWKQVAVHNSVCKLLLSVYVNCYECLKSFSM